ncbi:hypothetical protein, partial [Treponema sp. R80B11-R83G3]
MKGKETAHFTDKNQTPSLKLSDHFSGQTILSRDRNTQHATRNTQHATRNTQHATRNTQHATRNTQHATRNTQHAT